MRAMKTSILWCLLCLAAVIGCLVMFGGCTEINTLEVEFSTNNSVVANGEKFVLDTREDGFMIRSRFPAAEKIIFKGLEHCRMSAVWNLIDVRRPKECLTKVERLKPVGCYEVVDRAGKNRSVKWYGRFSDSSHLNDYDQSQCLEVDCANSLDDFHPRIVDAGCFLHVRFSVDDTPGELILDVLEKFDAAGGSGNDVYLLPY